VVVATTLRVPVAVVEPACAPQAESSKLADITNPTKRKEILCVIFPPYMKMKFCFNKRPQRRQDTETSRLMTLEIHPAMGDG
jgi:hypothetical protein